MNGIGQYNNGQLIPGVVLFLSANEGLELSNITEDLLLYQALPNVFQN